MTAKEWALIIPITPACRHFDRSRTTELHEVVNALFYIASTGCKRRMLAKNLPPYSTVQVHLYEWRVAGLWTLSAIRL